MPSTVAKRQHAVKAGEEFDALLHRVVALNKLFATAGEAMARPSGQTLARTLVLRQIEHEPASVADIARRLQLKRQSVQRVADLLADDGLLGYRENPRHRRAKLAHLTDAGRAALERVAADQRRWAEDLGQQIGTPVLEQVNRLLDEVLGVVRAGAEAER